MLNRTRDDRTHVRYIVKSYVVGPSLCLMLGILIAISTIAMVVLAESPVPFGDQWFNIVSGKTHDLTWFFALHNEHRLVIPRIVFILDHDLDDERNNINLSFNVALLMGIAALMLGLLRRAGLARSRSCMLVWAGLALGLFSGIQAENLIEGFQVQFFGVCFLAITTFAVLARGARAHITLALTVLLSAAASCTLSAGLLVGVVAGGLAAWLRRPFLHVVIIALFQVLISACYLLGYRSPRQHSPPLEALFHFGEVILYFFAEVGGPPATLAFASGALAVVLAIGAGAVGLALLAVQIVWSWRDVSRNPAVGALLATACFCVAFAGLTSVGRWSFGPGQALAGRYQTPMLLFWFCCAALLAYRASHFRVLRRIPPAIAPLVVLILITCNQPRYMQFALRVEALETASIPALLSDVADPKALSILSDRPADAVLDEAEALRWSGASVFNDRWSDWLGEPFENVTALADLPMCRGSFATVTPVGTGPRAGWSASGRLEGTGRFHGRPRIVFVGDDGRVGGFGLGGLSAVAVGAPGPRTAIDGDYWRGAFKASSAIRVAAYVLGKDDRAVCSLGHVLLDKL